MSSGERAATPPYIYKKQQVHKIDITLFSLLVKQLKLYFSKILYLYQQQTSLLR